jgi:hypothetical protein
MARSYAVTGGATNTQSSTLPSINLLGTSSVRGKLFAFDISSEASPADNSVKFAIQRGTTAGTPGSNPSPFALDPGDPAAQCTCGLGTFSVGPTLTANALLWLATIQLRIPYHWQCAPGKEMVIPATANNGLNFMPLVVTGSAYTNDFSLHFEE